MRSEKEDYELREKFMYDFPYYAENTLKIIPEEGNVIPFKLKNTQLYVHNKLEEQHRKKGYVRANILKPRKPGISTLIEGRFYWKVTHRIGVGAMIMTEADQSRDSLFRMVKTYHENMLPELKPATKASNEKALVFDTEKGDGLKSRYDVKTCDSKGGKGLTTHYNHWSEAAYFSVNAMANLSGLMESIPSRWPGILNTEVIKETTANGSSGHFYDEWKESEKIVKDGGDPEYINIFLPWTFDHGYRLELNKSQINYLKSSLTHEEKVILRHKNPDGSSVTLGNIAWRRWKIKNVIAPLGFTKEDIFKQWYPLTPDEAFVYSGRSLFSTKDLKKAEFECFNPISVGTFTYFGKYVEDENGEVKIWQYPKIGESYVIGADVAEGIQGDHRDYSCADVLKCSTGQQVAHIHCKKDPDQFGEILNHLGRYYNNALLAPEANNHGLTTITTLKHKNYPRLYQRETLDSNANGRKVKKAGWLTTAKSKYKLIDQLVGIVRDGDTGICNKDTLAEFQNFSILEDGTFGGKPGCHDDRVMSYAISHELLITMPTMRLYKEKRVRKMLYGERLNLDEAIATN